MSRRRGLLAAVGPGLLVAATGVGAGDLATAAFAGSRLGTTVLWAVVVGAALKWLLNEGLARWQLVTGETLLEGAVRGIGWPVRVFLPLYLVPWSFFVGAALMGACGVAAHALVPVLDDPADAKVVLGAAHGLVGAALVRAGGFRLFERAMSVAVAVMFVTVVVSALLLAPDAGELAAGLLVPRVPAAAGGAGWTWTLALAGGVGGTLTVLAYGYWIREQGIEGERAIPGMRVDLAVGYAATAVFGLAMVSIGSTLEIEGGGAGLVVAIGDALGARVGPLARWAFLLGAWCAVASSLLGVWQSVPYLVADLAALSRGAPPGTRVRTDGRAYRGMLYALATVPVLGLFVEFERAQRLYAVVGAMFLPLLALTLLVLNGRAGRMGARRDRPATRLALGLAALVFVALGAREVLAAW